MPQKFMKPGRVVIILQGTNAGNKAVILKTSKPTQKHKFYHCILAGISQYPKRITPGMDRATIKRRSQIKTFIKVGNYKHLLPTRYRMHICRKWKCGKLSAHMLNAKDPKKRMLNKQIRQRWQRTYFRHAHPAKRWFFKKLYF